MSRPTFTDERAYEHPNDLREGFAADFLRKTGMKPEHPDYQMFLQLILRICENTRWRNSQRKSVGRRLHALTNGETVSAAQLVAIRKIADDLAGWSAFPDRNALDAVERAVRERVLRGRKSNDNLIIAKDLVTDEQIRNEVAKGGTRAEVAARLGFEDVRQLYRRLGKLGLTSPAAKRPGTRRRN